MKLETVPVESGEFRFTMYPGEEIPDVPFNIHRNGVETGFTNGYQIWIDINDIHQVAPVMYFKYTVYARSRLGGTVTRFDAHGAPVGTVDDQIAAVFFTIRDGMNPEERGTIETPIFGSTQPDALSSSKFDKPQDAYLASEMRIPLHLTNALKRMPVTISEVPSASFGDGGLWEPAVFEGPKSSPFATFTFPRGSREERVVVLKLKPRTASAVATALIPRGKGRSDDTITVRVAYASLGRMPGELTIEVPVHFVPWPPILLPVVAAGAVLGWLLHVAATKKETKRRDSLRALGAAVASSVVIELLAMAGQTYGGDFKIAGQQIDPFQIPYAVLIGFFTGLAGFKSLACLRKIASTLLHVGSGEQGNA